MRCLIVLCLVAGTAHAEDAGPAPVMRPPPDAAAPAASAMASYFRGEIIGGFTLVGMGVANLGVGGALLATSPSDAVKGAAYPMLGFGVAHLAAGVFVTLSSANRIRRFGRDIPRDPESWLHHEDRRMRGVATQFLVLKVIEGIGIAGGIGMAAYGHERDDKTLTGVGIALAGELAATLIFDVVAARRAFRYRRAIGGIAF